MLWLFNIKTLRLTSQPKIHVLSDNFTSSLDVLNMKTLNDAIEVDSYILGVGDSKIQFFIKFTKKKNFVKTVL